ncbi:GNAT family N-acetyltransferase [Nocardioides alkalitolerans]|uniref:GNAT family N-acetyltransferase n=1 Tax=Nocardioides alkalitolerans TaxID=281714 RepID=UPI00041EF868|nr:GNAT family protein [Nocardioides alkalitolerans]
MTSEQEQEHGRDGQGQSGHGQPVGAPLDWAGATAVSPDVLEGRWVRLEPLSADHVSDLHAATATPEEDASWTYLPEERPGDVAETARRVAAVAADRAMVTWAVVPASTGRAEGRMSLMRTDLPNGTTEIGWILLGPALRRTTAATEAVALLADLVFAHGFRRLEWKCDSLNAPSRRAAARLGFTHEGRFRQAVVTKGRNRDTDWFSIVDHEWPALRASYDAWLDPANHDDEGRQRRGLVELRGPRA